MCTCWFINEHLYQTQFGLESESNSYNTDFEEFGDNELINPEYDRLEKVRNFLRFQTENDNSENEIESPNENDTPSELNTIKQTCRCGQQCFSKFQESDILNHVFNVKEMEKNVKDIYIMGSYSIAGSSSTRNGIRSRNSYNYSFKM